MSSPKPSQKLFRTDHIKQQQKPFNFRFPQAKRINSAEINQSKFIPKSYQMTKYSSITKMGKKSYRKHHFFTAKSLDYRNRVPQLWKSSSQKNYISKNKQNYYQQKKVGAFLLDHHRRRKRYTRKNASSMSAINDSQRQLTLIGMFAKFFMDDIMAKSLCNKQMFTTDRQIYRIWMK